MTTILGIIIAVIVIVGTWLELYKQNNPNDPYKY
jgi:hypothetical protein